MSKLLRLPALASAAVLALAFGPGTAQAQKALVYCPTDEGETCSTVVAALSSTGAYPEGVDKAFDGSNGTVDLKTADLFGYSVLVVPSLSDDTDGAPFALLRDATVAGRVKTALLGRRAFYSGTPDLGTTNRLAKNVLIANLARWAGANHATVKAPGLVVLQDNSESEAARYDWVRGITGLTVTADVAPKTYASVRTLTAAGMAMLSNGGTQLAYDNMASFGFYFPSGAPGISMDAVGQTGTAVGGQVVLVTSEGANTGGAWIKTDKDDYAPGDTATITGGGFNAGEKVTMTLHEDPLVHQDRTLTATADAQGNFVHRSWAPEVHDLYVRFVLTAVGQTSGDRAQTTFTDGENLNELTVGAQAAAVLAGGTTTFPVSIKFTGNGTCAVNLTLSGLPNGVTGTLSTSSITSTGSGNDTRNLTVTANVGSSVAANGTGTSFTVTATENTAVSGTKCTPTSRTATGTLVISAPSKTATNVMVAQATGTFGGTAGLTATLRTGTVAGSGTPVSGKDVSFQLNGTTVGTATTNTSGVATLSNASLANVNAGSYPSGIQANFAGDVGFTTSSGSAALTVNAATPVVTFTSTAPTSLAFNGTYTPSASTTSDAAVSYGVSGPCSLAAGTITMNSGTGSCIVTASVVATTNYTAAAATPQSIAAAKATATVTLVNLKQTFTGSPLAATATTVPANLGVNLTYDGASAAPTDVKAGGYAVVATIADANYQGTATGTLTIDQAPTKIAITWTGGAYDGQAKTATAIVQNAAGTTIPNLSTTLSYSGSAGPLASAPKDAGTYTVKADFNGTTGNYGPSSNTAEITIARVPLTVTADDKQKDYDGNPFTTFTSRYAGFVNGETAAVLSGTPTYAGTAVSATNAGDYVITPVVSGVSATNYTFTAANGALKILKANQTITFTKPADPTYGDAALQLAAQAPGGAVAFTATGDGCALLPANGAMNMLSVTAAGSCTVTASQGGDANYNAATSVSHTLTIKQAPLRVAIDSKSRVYGEANPAFTSSVTGAKNGDVITVGYSTTAEKSSPVGTYQIVANLSGDKLTNYDVTTTAGTLTVTKAPLTISATDAGREYGDANPALTGSIDGLKNGDAISASYTTDAVASSPVGPYKITAAAVDAAPSKLGNYDLKLVDGTLTVRKATLTITGATATREYGNANPSLVGTATGAKNGEQFTVTGTTSATPASSVGMYDVDPAVTGATLGNYSVTAVKGRLTVTKASLAVAPNAATKTYGQAATLSGAISGEKNGEQFVAVYQSEGAAANAPVGTGSYPIEVASVTGPTLSNYDVQRGTATLTVKKASLVVTPASAERRYGAANPTFTGVVDGVVNQDGITATYSSTATAGSPVGTYPIAATLVDPNGRRANYDVTLNTGTLKVTTAPLTIAARSAAKAYGAVLPTFAADYAGFVNGETASVLVGTLGFETTATASSDVGDYDVTPEGVTSSNYAITFAKGTLSITKAPLTVTAKGATREYGEPNPKFETLYSGFVLGQSAQVLGGTLTFTGAGAASTASTPIGTYAIVPAGLTSKNYAITFDDGQLTIAKATLTVTANPKSKVYGQAVTLDGAITGQKNGESFGATYASAGAAADAEVGDGSYDITVASVTGTTLSNYTEVRKSATLTVGKAPLTVTADDKSKVYGEDNPAFTATYGGFVLGQTQSVLGGTLSFATSAVKSSGVGSYPVTPSGRTSGNYAITYRPGNLTVEKAPLSVRANDKARKYGEPNPAFDGTLTGIKNADAITASYRTAALPNSPVGTYPIEPVLADPTGKLGNYAVTSTNGTLTIGKALLTVKANDERRVYGDANPVFSASFAGFQNGETLANSGVTGSPALATTATPSTAVGDAPISAAVGSLTSTNYDFAFSPGTLRIEKAPLSITVDAKERLYGDANPVLTGKVVGLKNQDAITASYSTIATVTSGVGPYEITAQAVDATPSRLGNYEVTLTKAVLTVKPAPLSVKANDANRAYGDANPALSGTLTGVKNGDAIGATYGTQATGTSPVGSYAIVPAIQATSSVLANYLSPALTNGTLMVRQRQVTVTANAQTKIQGGVDPALTYRVTGGSVVNGDAFTGALSRAPGETPGAYLIGQSNLALSTNYALTYVEAALTITPNAKPSITSVEAPIDPQQLVAGAASVTARVMFADADPVESRPYTLAFNWGDGTTTTATSSDPGLVTQTHTYKTAGVYRVSVTLGDKIHANADTKVFEYVVVYDPNGGFVTGGGWVTAAQGSCNTAALAGVCASATGGRANFGFVSKYQKGATAPSGNTEFQFHAGNLNFKSTAYQWLVIAGSRAQYKGTGTINGSGSYQFVLTAVDGKLAGTGSDQFRIKITNGTTVVFDNMVGQADDAALAGPSTTLQGGNIAIQQAK